MRNRSIKVMLALLGLFCFVASFAASWPSVGPARDVVTLVVCSNNQSPRLLAELIQAESKQPYLIFPAPQGEDTRIFFVPSRGPAIEIPETKLAAFVRFLSPRRIVVLGNESYVPRKYISKLDRSIPLFIADCEDWERIAEELAYMLNISSLRSDYKKLRDKMLSDSRLYRPISKPAPKQAPAQAEPVIEEVALDENAVVEEPVKPEGNAAPTATDASATTDASASTTENAR